MSVRASSLVSPLACSGEMYCGVPTIMSRDRVDSPTSAIRASPKSVRYICPLGVRITLDGLMSRWSIFCS